MIAAVVALASAVSLAVSYFADEHPLGYVALGLAVVAGALVLLPTRTPVVEVAGTSPQLDELDVREPDVEHPDVELVETTETDAGPEPTPEPTDDGLVLVIPGRRRYHRPGCSLLADHETEKLTEEEAREEEFTACTRCVKD